MAAKLAMAHIERGDTDKGLEMIRDRLGIAFPRLPDAMETLVTKLIEQGRLKDAIEISLDVIAKGSLIHFETMLHIARALTDSNRHEEAKSFISASAENLILPAWSTMSQNMIRLMSHVEKCGDASKVKDFTDFLVSRGLLDSKTNYAYSGLINVHLNTGDLETAVDTFERLVEKHRTVPLYAHLIRALIKAEDMEKMQRVIDICISTGDRHGEGAFHYKFAMHLLEMEKDSAAENLLKTPGLPDNHESVRHVCSSLAAGGNLEALKKFNAFTRGIRGIDRKLIYSKMIVASADDLGALTSVLEDMWSEGIRPSRISKSVVTMAFRSADQPVPKDLLS